MNLNADDHQYAVVVFLPIPEGQTVEPVHARAALLERLIGDSAMNPGLEEATRSRATQSCTAEPT